MARIRTIKPEWVDHPCLSRCSHGAATLWFYLVSQADDQGRGRFEVDRVFARLEFARGTTMEEFKKTVDEAAAMRDNRGPLVVFYEADQCGYYAVPGWARNQRIDKPQPSSIPEPPAESWEAETEDPFKAAGVSRDWWSGGGKYPLSKREVELNGVFMLKAGHHGKGLYPPTIERLFAKDSENVLRMLQEGSLNFEKNQQGEMWNVEGDAF